MTPVFPVLNLESDFKNNLDHSENKSTYSDATNEEKPRKAIKFILPTDNSSRNQRSKL